MGSVNKGIAFERRVKKFLQQRGCVVFRQAKSSFPDLIVFQHGQGFLIECKMNKYLSREEKRELLTLARLSGCAPMVAWRNKKKRNIVIELLKGDDLIERQQQS